MPVMSQAGRVLVYGGKGALGSVLVSSFKAENFGSRTEELSRERRKLWLTRIYRKDYDPDPEKIHNKVCSDHFVSGKKADLYDVTNPDWAPSLLMGTENDAATPVPSESKAKQRYDRAEQRREKKCRYIAAETLISLQQESTPYQVEEKIMSEKSSCKFSLFGNLEQTDSTHDPGMCDQIRSEFQRATTENILLKEQMRASVMTAESLSDDPERLKHYTGLIFMSLIAVFNIVSDLIPHTSKSALTKFEKLMVVLMKLRLNLSVQDLGYRFKVSASCVSNTFNDVIHVLYVRLRDSIIWPEREDLRVSMPMEFRKHFGLKVSIVIDCFEIFIERPSNYDARAQTWSNYKHHNTTKFLIWVTPQGVVSFISEGYGGRASDRHVTEDCGLLEKLLPGDLILADRGFDIKDSVGLKCAEVKIPAFTRGKKNSFPQ